MPFYSLRNSMTSFMRLALRGKGMSCADAAKGGVI